MGTRWRLYNGLMRNFTYEQITPLYIHPVNMQVSLRYRHLPDLYRTYRIPFTHTGLVPFQYLHASTGTIPANTFVDQYRFTIGIVVPAIYRQISSGPSVVKPVPIIYQQIACGPVPFSYRDTGTHSITANSFWTGGIFLLGYWYPEFTDKYLLGQYHFTASTPLYISQYHKTETYNAATTSKLVCVFRHLLWYIRENSWECSNLF